MKKALLLLGFLVPFFAFAQLNVITGTIQEDATTEPANKATVTITSDKNTYTVTTNEDGKFVADVETGEYKLEVKIGDKVYQLGSYKVDSRLVNVGYISYKADDSEDARQNQENIPTISLSESENKEGSSSAVSSALNASRDPFVSTASFIFSEARFRIRGYEQENFVTYMNGIPVNDLDDGGATYSQWGGLNNVMMNRENVVGLQPATFTYGGIGASYALDSRASKQRKQLQLSYAVTNRNYRHRLMATYSTGMLKHGWAVSASFSRRWAYEGYVPGTFYDGYSYFLSVDKYFGSKHSLSLTAFGAPTKNGRQSAATQEMYDLAGSNYYNPNWGWQNGVKRNAKVGYNHLPMFILTHEFKIDNRSSLMTAAGFSFGVSSVTAIDWNNAANPAPDYYRYLPSYQEDSTQKALVRDAMTHNEDMRQINWDNLYQANAMSWETIDSVNGDPTNSVTGKRARYIVENRIQNIKKFDFASTYNNNITDHISISAGITYQMQLKENYKKVVDLLGADFYVDVNQFAERQFPDSFSAAQNDVNRPNRILYEGDKFGYDYMANIHRASVWATPVFRYNKVDFFVGTELSLTSFWREGLVKNGLFPLTSQGKSVAQTFFNYAFKAGVTYKIDGRNYLYLNGTAQSRAPYFEDAFVSPRTRNDVANNLKSENIFGGELGYQLRTPNVKLKADLFFTQFNNQTKTITFYHDDLRTFVNYTLTGMNSRHWGLEVGSEFKIWKGFSATAVGSFGRYTYTSRPTAYITEDNSATLKQTETVYQKNFNVGGVPQLATSFGISYRDPKFWFISVNFNYYDWMWLNFNPARRTIEGVAPLEEGSTEWNNVVNQTRLKGQFMMDIFGGYSWLLNNQFKSLKKRYYLVFNVGINNVTNNQKFVTGGFEQMRFDFFQNNVNKFPPKLFYAYGTSYFVSLAFRMQ